MSSLEYWMKQAEKKDAEIAKLRGELQNCRNKLKASGREKLRAQVAALRDALDDRSHGEGITQSDWFHRWNDVARVNAERERAEKLEAERDALLNALRLFGEHKIGCPCLLGVGACNCGFHAALAAKEK